MKQSVLVAQAKWESAINKIECCSKATSKRKSYTILKLLAQIQLAMSLEASDAHV